MKVKNCPHCSINLDTVSDRANHVRWCENNPNRKVAKKYSPKSCIKCGATFIHSRNKCCSAECARTTTEETKDAQSDSRHLFLKENPEKHPWKNKDKFISEPCEIVKKYLVSKNINFVEEWSPLIDRFFSIDIAFPDIKFGIEINGNQHYNRDGTLKDYYQRRHDEIVSSGWTIVELHYSVAWDLKRIDDIITLREQPDYSEYIKAKKDKEAEKLKNKPEARGAKLSRNTSEKWEPYKKIVESSGIDFSKFGWGVKLSEILGTTPQHAKRWMKKYFPEIYESVCHKVNRKEIS
jgi:hypothetical protein